MHRIRNWKQMVYTQTDGRTEGDRRRQRQWDGGLTTDVHSSSQWSDGAFKWSSTGMQTEQAERGSLGASQKVEEE